jgi:Ca-activated chloride channel family protein
LGRGFNEELMIAMAQAGGGQQYYGQTAADLYDSFDEELALLQAMYLREINVKLLPAPGVIVEALSLVIRNTDGSYRLSDLAWGAETWMAVRLHVTADSASKRDLLAAVASGKTANGTVIEVSSGVLKLPTHAQDVFNALPADDLVSRRFQEVAFGNASTAVTDAMRQGDMRKALALLDEMGERFANHPWLRQKLSVLKRLAEQDTEMMIKEASYSRAKFSKSLVSKQESLYAGDETNFEMPAFLRKKAEVGRGKSR